MRIDLTPVLQAIIALIAALVSSRLIPWLKGKVTEQQFDNLNAAARVAVYAAEQIFKSGDNEKKLQYAIDQLGRQGFDVSVDTIRAAVEKAVYEMKNENRLTTAYEQRATEKSEDDTETDYHMPQVEDWPLAMIVTFCEDNGIPTEGCVTKNDYIYAVTHGPKTEPPDVVESED